MFSWNINFSKNRTYYQRCDMIHRHLLRSIFHTLFIKGVTIQMFFSSLVKSNLFLGHRLKVLFFTYLFFIHSDKLPKIICNTNAQNTKQSIYSFKMNLKSKKFINFLFSRLYFEGSSRFNFLLKKKPSILSSYSFEKDAKVNLSFQ